MHISHNTPRLPPKPPPAPHPPKSKSYIAFAFHSFMQNFVGSGGGGCINMVDVQIECIEDKFLVTPRISSDGGGKNQHPKKSHAELNFGAIKICRKHIEYPRKSLLKSIYPKIYLPKFSYPTKIPKSKISNAKQSFEHQCHLKSRVPPVWVTQERGLLQRA